jgi:uncharacterized membrane protein
MVNHFPVILAVVGTFAIVLAMLRGRRASWLYGTISLALAALTVIPTYFSGEPAEKALHRPWYIARGVIHTHEDAAKISAILVVLAGLVAVIAWRRLVRYPREVKMPGALRTALLLTSVAASVSIGYASWLGGRIMHDAPALQGPAPAGYVAPGTSAPVTAPAPSAVTPPADTARAPITTTTPGPALPRP